MGVDTEFDDPADIYQRNARGGAQVITIDSSKHVNAVAMCAIVCGISAILCVWSWMMARDAITEYRVMLNHTMEMQAKQDVLIKQIEELQHADR